MSNPGYSETHA